MKLQGSGPSNPKTLQSQISLFAKTRFSISHLTVVHERLTRALNRNAVAGVARTLRPIVWPNGVLASLAVGLLVKLVCPWHAVTQIAACCEFDSNYHRVETNRLDHAGGIKCYLPFHGGRTW